MQSYRKGLIVIVGLIAVTSAALAYIGTRDRTAQAGLGPDGPYTDGIVTVGAELVQQKVLQGSQGLVSVMLTLAAADTGSTDQPPPLPVDLLVVLDRSGSMDGQKLNDAKQAVTALMDRLTPQDRLGLVVYANGVQTLFAPVPVTAANQCRLVAAVSGIFAGGGTNLGSGLQRGIDTFIDMDGARRRRKLILISDGLANQGITDPVALGQMAATGLEYGFSVSTVGVGYDFNEVLMTRLADHGAGSYYFLENPRAFARVFEREFQAVRRTAAADLKIRLPLKDGVRLVDAGGYPIKMESNAAVVNPGDLLAGQQRSFFLTFSVPTDAPKSFAVGNLEIHYQFHGENRALIQDHGLSVSCVDDPKAVAASVISDVWAKRVVQEEYSALKEAVADEIRNGKKHEALQKISAYESRNRDLNKSIGSPVVKQNLDQQVQQLIESVHETFSGPAAAVAEKKKQKAKEFQFEGYQMRRDKK